MKSIFKILILAAVPILAVTAVADQALAADKGSQLIFHSNMYHQNYISVSNTSPNAVTVLVQYYNDELKPVLYYLRVVTGGGTVLVDPFDHEIPGTAEMDDDDMEIAGTATNVNDMMDGLGSLPAKSSDEDGPGINSGRFVIVVTAVGANMAIDEDGEPGAAAAPEADVTTDKNSEENNARTVNVLFPGFLAAGMHGVDNIDNGGSLKDASVDFVSDAGEDSVASERVEGNNLTLTKHEGDDTDTTTKNVGGLKVGNAQPVAFNHLTGNFTEALISTAAGGSDQTASWGGSPVIRPAVLNNNNSMMEDGDAETDDAVVDYLTLTGADSALNNLNQNIFGGGRLAEKDGGGAEKIIENKVEGYTAEGGNRTAADDFKIANGTAKNRALTRGALVFPALYGGGDETQQIMLFLSAADNFGGPGGYTLIPAMTKYNIVLDDNMGDSLLSPADDRVFGGATGPDLPSLDIIVNGIEVMIDAGACDGTMIDWPWSLSDLTGLVSTASSGSGKFAGLDAMLDPMGNAAPGSIKFKRSALKCTMNHGDGDAATRDEATSLDGDGVPATDLRTYAGGTLIVEEKNTDRTFVTTGQAVLKFLTAESTFAASWSLKSPASMDDARASGSEDILTRVVE